MCRRWRRPRHAVRAWGPPGWCLPTSRASLLPLVECDLPGCSLSQPCQVARRVGRSSWSAAMTRLSVATQSARFGHLVQQASVRCLETTGAGAAVGPLRWLRNPTSESAPGLVTVLHSGHRGGPARRRSSREVRELMYPVLREMPLMRVVLHTIPGNGTIGFAHLSLPGAWWERCQAGAGNGSEAGKRHGADGTEGKAHRSESPAGRRERGGRRRGSGGRLTTGGLRNDRRGGRDERRRHLRRLGLPALLPPHGRTDPRGDGPGRPPRGPSGDRAHQGDHPLRAQSGRTTVRSGAGAPGRGRHDGAAHGGPGRGPGGGPGRREHPTAHPGRPRGP